MPASTGLPTLAWASWRGSQEHPEHAPEQRRRTAGRRSRCLPDAAGRDVNQIEVHLYVRQSDLLAVNAEHGIVTQAWSPIGGITFYRGLTSVQVRDTPALMAALLPERSERIDCGGQSLVDWSGVHC